MRVFITGASGFIGRALHERYAAGDHEVSGCDLIADPQRGIPLAAAGRFDFSGAPVGGGPPVKSRLELLARRQPTGRAEAARGDSPAHP
jgi:nucleoside-diphosphate-sugar epimerase